MASGILEAESTIKIKQAAHFACCLYSSRDNERPNYLNRSREHLNRSREQATTSTTNTQATFEIDSNLSRMEPRTKKHFTLDGRWFVVPLVTPEVKQFPYLRLPVLIPRMDQQHLLLLYTIKTTAMLDRGHNKYTMDIDPEKLWQKSGY